MCLSSLHVKLAHLLAAMTCAWCWHQVNQLLEPVRKHFQHDKEAKRILELITGWMQEPKANCSSELRRLVAPCAMRGTPTAVVFAPLASARPTLGAALDTLRCLQASPSGHAKVLWLRDWSAFSYSCLCGGKTRDDDLKAIAAANSLFVAALRAIAPTVMKDVQVVVQSEAILQDSSNYWISVINAGRAFALSQVQAVDEACAEAGQVISSLMHVADVLATSVSDSAAKSTPATSICTPPSQVALHQLACTYLQREEVAKAGLVPPSLVQVPTVSLRLKAETAAATTTDADVDAELLLFDGQPEVQRKMKKAFCEPRNVQCCPPLAIVAEAILPYGTNGGTFVVPRKSENGGDLVATDASTLATAFSAGDLHPGDLKPAARDAVDSLLQRVRSSVQGDPELSKADKEVQKVIKRMTSKGGKK